MKILHISLRGPYTDNWAYQENIIPRVQVKNGHDVTVLANCYKHAAGGELLEVEPGSYTLKDGVKVIRIRFKPIKLIPKRIMGYIKPYDVYSVLEDFEPDLILLHGLTVFSSNKDIIKYCKHANKKVVLVGDTHEDSTNISFNTFKAKLILLYYRHTIKQLGKYFHHYFAITPQCKDFACKNYKIPEERMDILPLGYEPEMCDLKMKNEARQWFRNKYGLTDENIIIAHGGKITNIRKTAETINSVVKLNNPNVKLVIFGGMDSEMAPKILPLIDKHHGEIIYLGHLTPIEYHKVFLASDLGLFPGGQSVIWQQAVGCGLPILIGNEPYELGESEHFLDYLNFNNNAIIMNDTTVEGICECLKKVLSNGYYKILKNNAESTKREMFSYDRISNIIVGYGAKNEKTI